MLINHEDGHPGNRVIHEALTWLGKHGTKMLLLLTIHNYLNHPILTVVKHR